MKNTKSGLKCTVEVGAIPMSRLINKNKLSQLKEKFNSYKTTKTTKHSLNRLSAMASNKQKESFARGEICRAEIQDEKNATKTKNKKATPKK